MDVPYIRDIPPSHRYDALVIGSGLTGAWVAKSLSEAGLEVLILEAGPRLTPYEVNSHGSPWSPERQAAAEVQPVQSQHPAYWQHNPVLFVNDIEHPYTVTAGKPFLWIRGRQVGGRSLTWGGVTLRLSDYELSDAQRDGIGCRWPICHEDVSSYYDTAERFLGVCGAKDNLSQLPDGCYRSPQPFTEAEWLFKTAVESRWPDRHVINGRGVAKGATEDMRWPAASSLSLMLPTAFRTGRVTLRADSIVSHLVVNDADGNVIGAAGVDRLTRAAFEARSRVTVLAASTIESVRILFNSRSRFHPEGVGNSTAMLGHNLTDHHTVTVAGRLSVQPASVPPAPFGGPHSISIPRYRNISDQGRLGFTRGYGVWGGFGRRFSLNGNLEEPSWFLTAVLEVLPASNNRVELDLQQTDAWGTNTVRISLRHGANENRMSADALTCLEEMAKEAGVTIEHLRKSQPGQYVHELGGACMGSDRHRSVLNRFNQCWDANRLFVVDGSAFPAAGWQNPTLTMLALAGRTSEYIIEAMRRSLL